VNHQQSTIKLPIDAAEQLFLNCVCNALSVGLQVDHIQTFSTFAGCPSHLFIESCGEPLTIAAIFLCIQCCDLFHHTIFAGSRLIILVVILIVFHDVGEKSLKLFPTITSIVLLLLKTT
jgi:hypothetical protein